MRTKKLLPFLFLLLLALLIFFLRRGDEKPQRQAPQEKPRTTQRGLNRNPALLEYTAHARCRMDCRNVSASDVKEILEEGAINYRKSDVQDKPCPTYAVEGYTNDNEHLRVVFAQCETKIKVVTCINLDEEAACTCPGDNN